MDPVPNRTEAWHEGLLEALPGGFLHLRRDGTITEANAEARRILCLQQDAATGSYALDSGAEWLKEDGRRCGIEEHPMMRALSTGEPQLGVTMGLRARGELSWAVYRAVPVRDDETITGAVAAFFDITERRQVVAELARNRELLRRAQQIAHVGSWEWDLRENLIRWTDELHDICGIPRGSFSGVVERALDPVHPDDRERVSDHTRSIFRRHHVPEIEYRIVRPDGAERIVWGGGRVIRDEGGTPIKIVGAIQDVTERRALEEQVRKSQRLDSIGHLAGGVAHDFNNLLQVILGKVDRMLEAPDADPQLRDVRSAAERASELTRQLLSFGRRGAMAFSDLDLNELVFTHTPLIQRMLGERHGLRFTPGESLGTVSADRTQIDQVLLNLCINARDAMTEGGSIEIRTCNVDAQRAFSSARPWATAESYVQLSVHDDGPGIAPEVRERIFEPFFSTKGVGEGTGLGLSVVYGIAKQHGGMIEVESELGAGTTFSIYLPAVARPPARVRAESAAPESSAGETILVVEDEPLVLQLAVDTLEDAGYRVLTARTGQEALSLDDAELERIDLLMTDMIMPNMRGTELIRRMRGRSPSLRALLTTGHPVEHDDVSDVAVVQKPYKLSHLLKRVREVLNEPAAPPLADEGAAE